MWGKVEEMKDGWKMYWGLYGGDGEKEEGGGVGKWMGIGGVDWGEWVGVLVKLRYMIEMGEDEEILGEKGEEV